MKKISVMIGTAAAMLLLAGCAAPAYDVEVFLSPRVKEKYLVKGHTVNSVGGFIINRLTGHGIPNGGIVVGTSAGLYHYVAVGLLIPDLERESGANGIGSADFLLQLDFAVYIGRQVEAHMQVGCACAAFHIEHLHRVAGVVLEDRPAVLEEAVQIRVDLIF